MYIVWYSEGYRWFKIQRIDPGVCVIPIRKPGGVVLRSVHRDLGAQALMQSNAFKNVAAVWLQLRACRISWPQMQGKGLVCRLDGEPLATNERSPRAAANQEIGPDPPSLMRRSKHTGHPTVRAVLDFPSSKPLAGLLGHRVLWEVARYAHYIPLDVCILLGALVLTFSFLFFFLGGITVSLSSGLSTRGRVPVLS